jgi:hypothetical protein
MSSLSVLEMDAECSLPPIRSYTVEFGKNSEPLHPLTKKVRLLSDYDCMVSIGSDTWWRLSDGVAEIFSIANVQPRPRISVKGTPEESMRKHDTEGALRLLMTLAEPDWAATQLKALKKAKDEADASIEHQQSISVGNEASQAALEAIMADHKRQEASLNEREARLKDAEQQHKLTMEQGHSALNRRESDQHLKFVQRAEELKKLSDELSGRERSLDGRSKELIALSKSINEREAKVIAREDALAERQRGHDERERRIREAMQ